MAETDIIEGGIISGTKFLTSISSKKCLPKKLAVLCLTDIPKNADVVYKASVTVPSVTKPEAVPVKSRCKVHSLVPLRITLTETVLLLVFSVPSTPSIIFVTPAPASFLYNAISSAVLPSLTKYPNVAVAFTSAADAVKKIST